MDVTSQTEHDPPKSDEATLDANVTGSDDQPVTDAEVSAGFYGLRGRAKRKA